MKKEELEELASKALCALVGANGGSIESSLDDMRIDDEGERKAIKKWFGWEEEPRDDEELKEIFQDLASQYDECDDIEDALDSLVSEGELTDEEYDIIQDNWDDWLPQEN